MRKIASIPAAVLAGWLAAGGPAGGSGASTAPASGPATASAPAATATAAAPGVRWHETYEPAVAEARKRDALLVVLYFDPAVPACDAFQEMTLSRAATKQFLGGFAACRLNVTDPGKKKRFAETGAKETPLTQVLTPEGKLLDSIPGCIIPASAFCERLQRSLDYRAAGAVRPVTPASRWRAVQARLGLSTRAEAMADIRALLKLDPKKLPAGLTPGRLHLAAARALPSEQRQTVRQHLEQALAAGPKDAEVGGEAILMMARQEAELDDPGPGMKLYARYIEEFPDGPGIAQAYLQKATLEFTARKDPGAAIKTLEEFIRKHPDDAGAVEARRLLESFRLLKTKGGT